MSMNNKSLRFKIWESIGRIMYLLTWPGIWLVVKLTPPRTRVVLIVEGKILLTKDWLGAGRWNLPGGGLHRNEPEIEGAARELFEETGIKLESSQLTFLTTAKAAYGMSTNLIFYQVTLSEKPEVTIQKFEILDYRWIELSKVKTIDLDTVSRQAILSLIAE